MRFSTVFSWLNYFFLAIIEVVILCQNLTILKRL